MSGPGTLAPSKQGGMSAYKEALKRFAHGALDPLDRALLALEIGRASM